MLIFAAAAVLGVIGGSMLGLAAWRTLKPLPLPEEWESPYGKFNVDDVRRIEALARRQRQH